jgi:hypothetical protein
MTQFQSTQEEAEAIRLHPSFRALVDELAEQRLEATESFLDELENKRRGVEDGTEK